MRRNILAALLLFIGTSLLWLVLCWNLWGRPVANNTTTEIQKQDSIINYNAGEYDRLLTEQIELYKQLRTYEDAQLTAKTTYKRTRSSVIIRDTVTIVDVIRLVNSCDSVIASDSLVINNLKEQINIEEEKIDNLQEVVEAYEQKENILTEEINNLAADKKKLEKQKKRRNRALVVTSSVAILSTFVLSILL
jgi:DNA repair exonuclease SbcCD ATPase subunit